MVVAVSLPGAYGASKQHGGLVLHFRLYTICTLKNVVAVSLMACLFVLTCHVAFGQAPLRTSWQAEREIHCGLAVSSSNTSYTNSSGAVQVITGASFQDVPVSASEDGAPITQLQLAVYSAGNVNQAQVVLFPVAPIQYASNVGTPTTLGSASNLCLTLEPGGHINVIGSRIFGANSNTDATTAYLTLSGYSLPASYSTLPWQRLMSLSTPTTLAKKFGGNSQKGETSYTNIDNTNAQAITNLSYWGGAGGNASTDAIKQIRLYTEKLVGSSWSHTGQAVLYPMTTSGQSLIVLNLANLKLILQPGERLVADSYSSKSTATGRLTLSGYSFGPAAPDASWQMELNLQVSLSSTPVTSVSRTYTNLSSTTAQVITNLSYLDLGEDQATAGAPFTSIFLTTEHLSGATWVATGRQVVYIPTVPGDYSSADLILDGLNLVLNPQDRLVVTAVRPFPVSGGGFGGGGSLNDGDDKDPTYAHLTVSGYSFVP